MYNVIHVLEPLKHYLQYETLQSIMQFKCIITHPAGILVKEDLTPEPTNARKLAFNACNYCC